MSSLTLNVNGITLSAAKGATDVGIISWSEPPVVVLNNYAPDVEYMDGSTALSWRRQHTLANIVVAPFGAADETEAQTLIDALQDAMLGIGWTLTRVRNGVSRSWRCDAGSITPAGETTRIELDRPNVSVYNVSIPCLPVPTA